MQRAGAGSICRFNRRPPRRVSGRPPGVPSTVRPTMREVVDGDVVGGPIVRDESYSCDILV